MYYEVIPEPIDLTIIRAKIDARKYETHHQLVSDLKLMFANAKHFNEEKSQVHQDAIYLEKLLKKKIKNLGPAVNASGGGPGGAGSGPGSTPRLKKRSSTSAAQQAAVSSSSSLPAVCRTCSTPSETTSKLGSGKYTQAADMLADFELMFDNACLFNETGSQIYQDALVLLRVVMEKRRLLRLDEDPVAAEVPDVMAAVRDVMKGLLTQTMNH
uniref:Bromo domain-containing protein n=1 Tax=Macrostomum lignano TaxID=282301 RepID=A0A1I8F2A9_9PLAT